MRPVLFSLLVLLAAASVPAREVQSHGVVFESWIRDTFFDGYRPASYTQKWDIPADANRDHGGIPVNPKAARDRGPVDLGDALRQFDIDEPFLLVIGYWRQEGDAKHWVNVVAPRIEPARWRALWGPVTRADLERLDALVKDRSLGPSEASARARAMKNRPPFSEAAIVLNPKIDARGQRRLQCSLRFADVFRFLCPDADPAPATPPPLWGVPVPDFPGSPPRGAAAP